MQELTDSGSRKVTQREFPSLKHLQRALCSPACQWSSALLYALERTGWLVGIEPHETKLQQVLFPFPKEHSFLDCRKRAPRSFPDTLSRAGAGTSRQNMVWLQGAFVPPLAAITQLHKKISQKIPDWAHRRLLHSLPGPQCIFPPCSPPADGLLGASSPHSPIQATAALQPPPHKHHPQSHRTATCSNKK